MQIKATKADIEKALERANEHLAGNLEFLRFQALNHKGTRFAVTLRVKSSKDPGHGRGHVRDGRLGRRLVTPCWHAYGIFMDSLPAGTEFMSRSTGWQKAGDAWIDWQAGSMMDPCMASQRCDCHEDGTIEAYLETSDAAREKCPECWEPLGRQAFVEVDVFDSPWQKDATRIKVHADPCHDRLTDTSWADFRYFHCDACERLVIRQCPSNGWHSYVRVTEEGEEVCLRCYEADLFENGCKREAFARNEVPGMFFNRGDLEEHGFEKVPGFCNIKIVDKESAKRFCTRALKIIDEGGKVAVDYEAMAIGGLEGYVTLWQKKSEDQEIVESEIQGRREMDAQDIAQEVADHGDH